MAGSVCAVASDRRLQRSRSNRFIAGVAGGLGEYFGLDPTLLRIGFVLFAFFGVGELAYLILWVVMPKEPR